MDDLVLVETDGPVRTLTLNRPEARNALNVALMDALGAAATSAADDDAVAVVVLTGSDPAFCAGLDLRELAEGGANLRPRAARSGDQPRTTSTGGSPWAALRRMTKPVIGAVNGPAVTGGLELVLACDFLVASERARFGDTHARVGAMPGGGMTGLLPQAVGLRRAKEMSFTGNFLDPDEALRLGLVNHVVPHDELLPTARRLAADIAGNDQRAVRRLKRNYDLAARGTLGDALALEQEEFRTWQVSFDDVAARREAIVERGRAQTQPGE
jgi:enoyl-CoA hydratase